MRERLLLPPIVMQFHFDAESYLDVIRAEVSRYDEVQRSVAASLTGPVERVLDLGAGTGQTSRAVLDRFPDASLVLLDQSQAMLAVAVGVLPSERVDTVIVGDMVDALPGATFDAVVSAFAIHHLDSAGKRRLFARVRNVVRPGGQFAFADVVEAEHPEDAVTPVSQPIDHPERLDDLRALLHEGGWMTSVVWEWKDLAVIVAA